MGALPPRWPLLVRFALLGVPSRRAAWFNFWLSVVLVLVCAGLGEWMSPFYLIAVIGVTAPLGYLVAILWVDSHGGWSQK